MPQEDSGASELNHPEEVFWVIFPANDGAAKVMKPGEQPFDLPATPVATQNSSVLRRHSDAYEFVGCDQLHPVAFTDALVQGVAVVSAVADQAFRDFAKKSLMECGHDKFCFMRGSARHVHGERKTMAVCDCHDFTTFA